MYLYDANCAVGPWPTDRPVYETVDGLLAEMDRLGIARALVSHTLARTYNAPYGNRLLMQEIAGQDRLSPCWTLLPPACGEMGPLAELLADLEANQVRAVRLYPTEHTYSLDDWQCGELFEALAERHIVVLLDLAETSWSDVDHVCRTYPGLSMILTRAGYRQLRSLFALLGRHDNLFCDLSNLCTYLAVEDILERFDSSRMLFGTGLPVADPGGPIARLFYTEAPQADLAAMAHSNIERLLARSGTEKGMEQ
jgi:hypothetical protein